MKKIIFLVLLFFNILPFVQNGKLYYGPVAMAQDMATEGVCSELNPDHVFVQQVNGQNEFANCLQSWVCNTERQFPEQCWFTYEDIVDEGGGGGNGESEDCAGVAGGSAYYAGCGCIGGTTGISNCDAGENEGETDCNGDAGGTASQSECGCIGGNTGIYQCPPPEIDCNGEPGGSAYEADCGCIGGSTGIDQCCICPTFSSTTSATGSHKAEKSTTTAMVSSTGCNCEGPPAPTVSLSLSKTQGAPLSPVTLTATLKNAEGISDIKYYYYGIVKGSEVLLDPQDNNISSLVYTVKVMGSMSFKVTVSYKINGQEASMTSGTKDFKSVYTGAEFKAFFAKELKSYSVAADAASGQTETGFSGEFNGKSIYLVTSTSTVGECDNPLEITFSANEDDSDANNTIDAKWTLGDFHTHPNFRSCPGAAPGTFGASAKDLGRSTKYPLFVFDYISYATNGSTGIDYDMGYKIYAYGPAETTY